MRTFVRVATLVLALVAFATFAWWMDSRSPVPKPAGGGVVGAFEAASPATAPPATAAEQAPAAAAGTTTSERREFPTADVSVGRPLRVQVWRGEVGVPAVQAEVFALEQPEPVPPNNAFYLYMCLGPQLGPPPQCLLSLERGRRYVTDQEGRAQLLPVEQRVVLAARSAGMFGTATVDAMTDGVVSIVLQADQTLTVKVVGPDGAPVPGMPVLLQQRVVWRGGWQGEWLQKQWAHDVEELQQRVWQITSERLRKQQLARLRETERRLARRRMQQPIAEPPQPLARRLTDEQGLAVFEHFQWLRRDNEAAWPEEFRDRFRVTLWIPLVLDMEFDGKARDFSGQPPADEVLVLRAPATGKLTIRTVDRDGRPYVHPLHVLLTDGEAQFLFDPQDVWLDHYVLKPQGEATVVFEHIPLGRKVHSYFSDESKYKSDLNERWDHANGHHEWKHSFDGPVEAGQHLEIDAVVLPHERTFYGKVLGVDGAPLSRGTLGLAVGRRLGVRSAAGGHQRIRERQIQLGDDGSFHFPYPAAEPPLWLRFHRGVSPAEGVEVALPQAPTIPKLQRKGSVVDIGTVQLERLAVLAGGVVVDDIGQPVAGARVQLQHYEVVDPAAATMDFVDAPLSRVESGDDGRFALFGARPRDNSRLSVQSKDHFATESAGLLPGEDGLRIVLQRKARLFGTMIVPEWMHPGFVRIELLADRVPSMPPGSWVRREGRIEGGTLEFDWLRAGSYTLTFAMKGFREPFLRIAEVAVTPEQDGVHPELKDLDLARFIHRFDIHAVDENGEPVVVDRPMLARLTHQDGRKSWVGLAMRGESSEVFSAMPQLEVFPMASGFVAEPQVLAPGRSEVVYRSLPAVEVTLAGVSAISQGLSVSVVLEQLDRGALPSSLGEGFDNISIRMAKWYERSLTSTSTLKQDDTARFLLPAGGPHKVRLMVADPKKRVVDGVQVDGPKKVFDLGVIDLDLVPGGEMVRASVEYSAAAVQAAVDAVRKEQ